MEASGTESGRIKIRDSGAVVPLLHRLRCSLAISTRPTSLILLGAADGQPTLTECPLYRPMGLAVEGNRLAIAGANELFIFMNVQSIARDLPDRPNYYDAVFVPRAMYFTGYCDLHDMVFDGGVILAVNTRFSCVCVIDGQYNFTPIWQPPFITGLAPEDRCHLNGMAFAGRRVRYVTMLGTSDQPEGWRDDMAEGGVLMEVPSGRPLATGLSMPHSPRLFDDRLYMLEGGRGRLLGIDQVSGERHVVAELPGFAHGLADYGGVLWIGMSKLRDRRGPSALPIESARDELMAGIAAIDKRSGEILGTLEFLNDVEEVYDIQVMPNILRPEIRDPVKWFEQPSVETPKGGFWLQRPTPKE
ncbi:MAG TPA: TIGR03032 family protein [Aliidongia sp.]|nr:TIGR03032 family protein [Aliidongia sp.]